MLSILRYIITGGGLLKRGHRPPYEASHALVDKYLFYRAHCKKEMPGCDGLLFTALGQAAGACEDVRIPSFEGEPGQWFRCPQHDCYPERSASDISKDMMMGLALWCHVYRVPGVAQRTLKRALLRGGNMGRPLHLISRTLMSPTLMYYFWVLSKPGRKVGLLGRLLFAANHWSPQRTYRAHLQSLSILLLARLEDGFNPISLRTLEKLAENNPRNALFAAMLERNNECLSTLMDTSLFPADSLPTTKNYDCEYLWSTDPKANAKDWLPGPQEPAKIHTGIDFLLAAAIYLKMV